MTTSVATPGRVLVTGATGYVGGQLVPALLERGWTVRVLTRSAKGLAHTGFQGDVDIVEGDATADRDLDKALADCDVAYFLLHSMDGKGDFVQRDRDLARSFAAAAERAHVGRIVYLGGLHPEGALSPHLESRREVGQILLDSGVPTAVLQAGVVLGDGSASFDMLRHLTERLPAVVAPRWLRNKIQPIAVDDAVHYLAEAATLPNDINRTFDIGGPDVLTYKEMMKGYAARTGLGRRFIATVPVLTPELASLWVGAVTPVKPGVARPLVGSLVHDAVCHEHDLQDLVPPPPGGPTPFGEAIDRAVRTVDPTRWRRTLARNAAMVGAAAVAGSLLTDPNSRWYKQLDKPSWQPPAAAFPIVWTSLYGLITVATTTASSESEPSQARKIEQALAANMVLNAGWNALFFRAHRLPLAAIEAAVLTASSADLTRRVAPTGRGKVAALAAYTAWSGFATVLTTAIARCNR